MIRFGSHFARQSRWLALGIAVSLATPARSQNTFATVDSVPGFALIRVSLAMASDGLPILAYEDYLRGDLKVLKCGNAGCTAGNILTEADTAGATGLFASIAVPADGRPVICYRDFPNGHLRVLKCGGNDCRSGNSISRLDTVQADGLYTALAIPADQKPVIVFQDNGNGGEAIRTLKLLKCGNPECSSGNLFTDLDTALTLPSQHSLALGADGLPVISYRKGGLRILKCGNAACTADNSSTLADPDTGRYLGLQTSLKVPPDGLPVVAYSNLKGTGLVKVLKCGNPACSSGNAMTLVDTNDVHITFLSLALGSDHLPVVGFFRNPDHTLTLLKCGTPACDAGNVVTGLDSTDKLGTAVSIAMAADGGPVIAYNDGRTSLIKVAKCGSPDCRTPSSSPEAGFSEPGGISVVDGMLTLSTPAGPGRVEIFALSGAKVFAKTLDAAGRVDLSGLGSGIHFVRLATPRGKATGRVILP